MATCEIQKQDGNFRGLNDEYNKKHGRRYGEFSIWTIHFRNYTKKHKINYKFSIFKDYDFDGNELLIGNARDGIRIVEHPEYKSSLDGSVDPGKEFVFTKFSANEWAVNDSYFNSQNKTVAEISTFTAALRRLFSIEWDSSEFNFDPSNIDELNAETSALQGFGINFERKSDNEYYITNGIMHQLSDWKVRSDTCEAHSIESGVWGAVER
jgi:hypothetical protein